MHQCGNKVKIVLSAEPVTLIIVGVVSMANIIFWPL